MQLSSSEAKRNKKKKKKKSKSFTWSTVPYHDPTLQTSS